MLVKTLMLALLAVQLIALIDAKAVENDGNNALVRETKKVIKKKPVEIKSSDDDDDDVPIDDDEEEQVKIVKTPKSKPKKSTTTTTEEPVEEEEEDEEVYESNENSINIKQQKKPAKTTQEKKTETKSTKQKKPVTRPRKPEVQESEEDEDLEEEVEEETNEFQENLKKVVDELTKKKTATLATFKGEAGSCLGESGIMHLKLNKNFKLYLKSDDNAFTFSYQGPKNGILQTVADIVSKAVLTPLEMVKEGGKSVINVAKKNIASIHHDVGKLLG